MRLNESIVGFLREIALQEVQRLHQVCRYVRIDVLLRDDADEPRLIPGLHLVDIAHVGLNGHIMHAYLRDDTKLPDIFRHNTVI